MTKKILLDRVKTPQDMRHFTHQELHQLANELRQELIRCVSKTGGHLGAGLGVVELTVALHAIFDTPRDRLIWDVSHQSYPHKILTGRRDKMHSLRQWGGLSGFTRRAESLYDPFGAAHSSTSISAALGFVSARELGTEITPPLGDAIAVIGDGAMSAGMAFEALNNASILKKRIIVILNDNKMSISPPVGAMSNHLSGLYAGAPFQNLKSAAKGAISLLPEPLRESARRAKSMLKSLTVGGTLFEALGWSYIGPIDGHNLDQLLAVLGAIKAHADAPIILHIVTQKGKGYQPSETADDKGHGVTKFNPVTGKQEKKSSNIPSYTSVFSKTLVKLAEKDPKITAITAAMASGTGLDNFAKIYPERCFDVGIAEQHAVTFAAGQAAGGLKPFCAIYSTFLQRAYDQLVHDVALQGLNVCFIIDRAGLVGADGPSHAGAFDIAYLMPLPGMVIMAPSDEAELIHMITTAAAYNDGPISIRFPRGEGVGVDLPEEGDILKIGKGRIIQKGAHLAFLNFGAHLCDIKQVAQMLENTDNIRPTIADARFAKPFDKTMILQLAQSHEALITIEEGAQGGFGAHIASFLADEGAFDKGFKYRTLCLPDCFIPQGTQQEMYNAAGLSVDDIYKKTRATLKL